MSILHHLCIGIDVSKVTLDIALESGGAKLKVFQVKNDEIGFSKLLEELEKHGEREGWRIVLEATSAYHRAVVLAMQEVGVKVLVLNPKQARDLARGLGVLRKNDRTDAGVLCACARMAWRDPEAMSQGIGYRLQEISRRIEVLNKQRTSELKRIQKPGVSDLIRESCLRQVDQLEDEIHRMEAAWRVLLQEAKELKTAYENIRSVPGCGEITARKVVSELLAAPRRRTAAQCVAYAGLAPQEQTSGTSLRRRAQTFSTGNKFLRTALYMGAISSIRNDELSKALYIRLIEAGKPKKVAIVAVMAKLMRRIAAVINRGTPWVRA